MVLLLYCKARIIQGSNSREKLAKCWRRAPYCDDSHAPTVAGRLLQAESLEFTHLPPTVEFHFFDSIHLGSSNCEIGVLRPLFLQEVQLKNKFYQEGTGDPTRMNLNETFSSMQQSIEGLARQFHNVASDVEELKRGKSSSTMKQRVADNFGGVNSPHYQRSYDNMSTQGCRDMSAHNSYPFHEGGFQGRPQARGGRRG
ncbi:hypothetical protein M9H77_17179 [Catharanthus roseus]|uniref:Uncharacterized protein n=1 Tax=Catharanthus roseus TaxID=4058 RepID=A0ACC0B3W7_CATRO|nr:hypothetical protein M9H77_17179 [Catharanthus roseus]